MILMRRVSYQAQTRIATFLTLRDRYAPKLSSIDSSLNTSDSSSTNLSGRNTIHIVNTHYDDQGKKSRGWASWLIRVMAEDWVKSGAERDGGEEGVTHDDLVIWMGDFSRFPDGRDGSLRAYRPGVYRASQTLRRMTRKRKDTSTLSHQTRSHTPHLEASSS